MNKILSLGLLGLAVHVPFSSAARAENGQGALVDMNWSESGSSSDPSDQNPVIVPVNGDGFMIRQQLLTHVKPTDPIYFLTFDFQYGRSTRNFIAELGVEAAKRADLSKTQEVAPIYINIDFHFTDPGDRKKDKREADGSTQYNGFPREREMLQWVANQWPGGVHVYEYNPYDTLETKERIMYIDHRKIFAVGDSLIEGGRNTGPLYLEFLDDPKSFVDVELFFKHQQPALVAAASDLILKMCADAKYSRPLPANPNYEFKFINVPTPARMVSGIFSGDFVPSAGAIDIPNHPAFLQTLKYVSDFSLFKSEWYNENDQFRTEMHALIAQEPRGGEIYMETPYFIPDTETLQELHAALKNGVKLTILTNSVYTCDGDSKAIPILMEKQFQQLRKEGASITYTNVHMVHAKVFGFRAQGEMFFGSNNLHRRSGLFDKEVMIHFHWDQNQINGDPTVSDPITYREQAWDMLGERDASLYAVDGKIEPNRVPFQSISVSLADIITRMNDDELDRFLNDGTVSEAGLSPEVHRGMVEVLSRLKKIRKGAKNQRELQSDIEEFVLGIDREKIFTNGIGDFL